MYTHPYIMKIELVIENIYKMDLLFFCLNMSIKAPFFLINVDWDIFYNVICEENDGIVVYTKQQLCIYCMLNIEGIQY